MSRFFKFLISFLVLLMTVTSCKKEAKESIADDGTSKEEELCQYEYGIRVDTLDIEEYVVKSGDNLSGIFNQLGFSLAYADTIVRVAQDVLDPKKLQIGKKYIALVTQDTLPQIKYVIFEKSTVDFSVVDFTQDSVSVYEFNKNISVKTHYAEGSIQSNLWNTIAESGCDPLLSLKLSDIYAWQIDFFDVKKGDEFKVIYEMAYIDDTIPLYVGDVKSAIFTHQGQKFVAIPFEQDSVKEFFDEEGNSLRKAFLKAPLNFHRISSRFSNSRFHPVLKRYRAHHGVDYVAPTGTPVRTIGDGVVIAKAFQKNGGGNYLKIKHNSTYTTTYMHLSRFAKGIAVGSRVQQGAVIGYVGSTGLSTGAHLDFRVHKNGTPIDPLKMESPPALPVHPELMDSFNIVKKRVLDELEVKNAKVSADEIS